MSGKKKPAKKKKPAAKKKLAKRWQPDFDWYMSSIDDEPASFVVDLAVAQHAPIESHPILLEIHVPMHSPRPDGLRSAEELEQLGSLEDQLVEALDQEVEAIYVGRAVHDGTTSLYLYVPVAHRDALDGLPDSTRAMLGDYEPDWRVSDDPEWEQYLEFLAPDTYAVQTISNRRLLAELTKGGDALDQTRLVDHFAYFPSRVHADQAAAALRAAGFTTDDVNEKEGGEAFSLQFHRDDRLSQDRPDEFVAEILDVILPLDGSYDGWGALHVPKT